MAANHLERTSSLARTPSFFKNDREKSNLARSLKIRLSPIGKIAVPRSPGRLPEYPEGMNFHLKRYLISKHLSPPEIENFIEEAMGGPEGVPQTLYRKVHDGTISIGREIDDLGKINERLSDDTGRYRENLLAKRAKIEETMIAKMRLLFHPDDLWMVEDPEVLLYTYKLHVNSPEGQKVIDASPFYVSHIGRLSHTARLQYELRAALSSGIRNNNLPTDTNISSLVRAIIPDETVVEWGIGLRDAATQLMWDLNMTPAELYNLREMPENNLLINTYEKISGYVRGLAFIDPTYKVPREMKTLCEIITAIVKEWMDIATGQKVLVRHVDWTATIRMSFDDIRFVLSNSDVRPPPPQIASEDNLLYARYFLENGCGPTQTGFLGPEEEPALAPTPAAPVAAATRRPVRRMRPRLPSDSDD